MANIKWTTEKVAKLKELLSEGRSVPECGKHFGLSRGAIYVAIRTYLPGHAYGQGLREVAKQKRRERLDQLKLERPKDLVQAQKAAFQNKVQNAKKQTQWEFAITMDDLVWPTHCPVLGIELDWFASRKAENSPSFDRIDPSKGYVPGNVAIISWRANRIKNDGSAEEHRRIAEWLSCN